MFLTHLARRLNLLDNRYGERIDASLSSTGQDAAQKPAVANSVSWGRHVGR